MAASRLLPPRFEVVPEFAALGAGVIVAIDRDRGRPVVFKIVTAAPSTFATERDQVREQFAVAAAVLHPNLVRLDELHEQDDRWGFTMELVDGPELIDWVRPGTAEVDDDGIAGWGAIEGMLRPRFLEGRVRTALGQIAGALAALHGAGVVHRGIKPANLRVDRVDRVVVLELGLAAIARTRRDQGDRPRTIEYMSPEEAGDGRVTTASDLYGLGAILFEIVTGRPPFVGAAADVTTDKLEHPAPRATRFVPELARDLDELCVRLLDRDPARRPSAADVAAQFGAPNQPRAGGVSPRARREPPLLGRDAELAALQGVLDARAAPLLYLVHGPTGVGKSALLDRVARDAARRGMLVCAGRSERGAIRRFAAWDGFIDGVGRHLAGLGPIERAALLPEDAAAITYLSPSFARVAPARPSWGTLDELTARGIEALRTLLARVTRDRPVVAILDGHDDDDLDHHNLALLRELMRPPAPALTIFLGARSNAPPPLALAAHLAGLTVELRVLEVTPLAEPAATALAARLLGTSDPDGAAALARRSGGNPLFLEQLAQAPQLDDDGLAALVAGRLAALPGSARAVLRLIAASGRPIRQDVLGSALGLTHRVVIRELAVLTAGRWVRTTGTRRNDLAELFHGVVGDAARQGPPLDGEHALLAAALDNSGLGDELDRVHHWTRAGDRVRASALAIAMVASARDSHDFTVAAGRCDGVLALAPPPAQRAALVRARADALVGIGDGPGAANAYLDAGLAADQAGRADDALDARRLAAEHLLRSGQIERGFAVAHAVAEAAEIDLARSRGRMLGTLMIERARSRLRGTRLPATPDPGAARLADVCRSLAVGFAMTDSVRAAWFTSRGVRAALDSGDRSRVARALALDSWAQVAGGGPGVARAQRGLALADRLIAEGPGAPDRDRAVRALIEAARGAAAFGAGEFAAAVAHGDRARDRYRACSSGFAFEARIVTPFVITATAWLGRWADAGRRRAALEREATASGDQHAQIFALSGYGVIADLAAGAGDAARDRIAAAVRTWPRDLAPAIHVRAIIALAACDLYQGYPDTAGKRLAGAWTSLDDPVEHVRANLLELSARAAIRCGRLTDATLTTRKLGEIAWAAGPALLLRASIAAHSSLPDLARELLAQGEAACDAAGLAAHATAAHDRAARLVGGAAGRAGIAASHARADALGLGDPARSFEFLVPWPAG